MKNKRIAVRRPRLAAALAGASVLFAAQFAVAQSVSSIPEVEVDRADDQLTADLRPVPDRDSVDTVLVFHNPSSSTTTVSCLGRNANGRAIGRAKTRVPARGLRFIRASDLSRDRDFIGSATCHARRRIVPTGFLLGDGITDLQADIVRGWEGSSMRFPAIASF